MSVPINQSDLEDFAQFLNGSKLEPLEGQGFELVPPRLNQIQPIGILGQEVNLNFWSSQQGRLNISAFVNGQVILNHQPALRWKMRDQLLQQLDMTGS